MGIGKYLDIRNQLKMILGLSENGVYPPNDPLNGDSENNPLELGAFREFLRQVYDQFYRYLFASWNKKKYI